ncbi:rhomboid family intramembrane serine protease [Lachnospiraceae bacterium C1.1]|nr:rhomboid family intramembrane serine protease [Lachnospiraceae bacterium C1.1]
MKRRLKISYNSPAVLTFVLICLSVLVINILTMGQVIPFLFTTYHSSLANPLTYIRFFTHVLGHIGWSHLINNASFILLLGPMLEEKYGSATIIKTIVITAVVTGIVNYIFFPNVGLCGASGIVFAFIIMASFTGFNSGEIPLTFILVAVIYIGQQVVEGITVSDNISNLAHIIGGAVGALLGYCLNKKPRYSQYK